MRKQIFFVFVFILLTVATGAVAQTRKPVANPDKIIDIQVLGSKRFSNSELVTASGLKIGDSGDDAMKKAAEQLAQSGMFSDVTYNYVTTEQGTRVKYQVIDVDGFIPIHADNFVWLSPDDLMSALEKREPLFRGEIPNGGEMYNKLADDMRAILADRHITATVNVMPQAPAGGGSIIGFLYRVEGVNIPIRSVEFPGASTEMNGVLEQIAGAVLVNANYSETKVQANAHYDFLPEYLKRGYLKAAFNEPTFTLQDPATNAVAVKLPLSEGLQYKLSAFEWSGNKTFGASDLTHALESKPGQPLNSVLLDENLHGITKIYGTRGYMQAYAKTKFTFDDAAQTVSAEIDINEGPQFHMGQVQFVGLSENDAATLRKQWKLTSADPYDSSYPNLFLIQAMRSLDVRHVSISIKEQANNDTKTVDVTIRFTPTGS